MPLPRIPRLLLLCIASVPLFHLTGCGSGNEAAKTGSSAERYTEAMAEFEKENYRTAQEKLNALLLQDPTGEYADDAQFYLAESYFRGGDYKLAAFNYNRVYTLYSTSPYAGRALYRSAESYANAAPSFERDQRDTRSALGLYESFIRRYPSDPLVDSARSRIVFLRARLGAKEFAVAELYRKMDDNAAALLYYDRVIADYSDTEYAQQASGQKLTLLVEMGRTAEATEQLRRTLGLHPEWRSTSPFNSLSAKLGL